MKINKKYTPFPLQAQNLSSPDGCFPLVLPAYQKLEGKTLSQFIMTAIQRAASSQQLGKTLHPLLISGATTTGTLAVLKGKSQLPFLAKLQRLAKYQKKIRSKDSNLISQLFSLPNLPYESHFSLRSAPVQALLRLLSEKQLWKKKDQLVYRDVSSQSIVSEGNIEWREEKQLQLEVKCFVEAKHEVFPLVIEDPMLFFSDLGVLVHANDKRYKKHIGKKIIIPVINKSIPVF